MSSSTAPDPPPVPRWTPWLAFGSVAVSIAAPVAVLVVGHDFNGLYGQDSFFYQTFATGSLRDALTRLRPIPDFTWPPGYPLIVALLSLVTGVGTLPGQVVSLVAGAAVPVFTILLAHELKPEGARWMPWLAGAVVALTPHLWQSSAVIMADTTGLASATLGAWALARYARLGSGGWVVLAAVAICFAIATRWAYALVALPLAVAGLHLTLRRRAPMRAALAIVAGLLVLAPVGLPMVSAALDGRAIPFSISLESHPWDPANAFRSIFDGPSGRFDFAQPMGLYYLLQPAQPYHLGPLWTLLAIPGLVVTLRAATVIRMAVLVGWPLLVLGFLAGDMTQNTRFFLAALPPLATLSALGVEAAVDGARGWASGPRRAVGASIVAVVGLGLAIQGLTAVRFTDSFILRHRSEQEGIAVLAAQVPSDARLIGFGATLALRHAGRADTLELYDQDPATITELTADGRPTYLIIPVDILAPQWATSPPGRAFVALRDGAGLAALDRAGAYQLLVVHLDE